MVKSLQIVCIPPTDRKNCGGISKSSSLEIIYFIGLIFRLFSSKNSILLVFIVFIIFTILFAADDVTTEVKRI